MTAHERKDRFLKEDLIFTVSMDDSMHVVSENHFYKSEAYYTAVSSEMSGISTVPSSGQVIEAYVVPICLEKAKLSGIEVSDWEILHQYASIPCVIYGLNYFSTPSEFSVVRDEETAKDVIKHVTNKGKYPFCYQKLAEGANIMAVTSVFGNVVENDDPGIAEIDLRCLSAVQDPAVQRHTDRERRKVFTLFIGAGEVFQAHQGGEAAPRRVPAEQVGPVHRRRKAKCLTWVFLSTDRPSAMLSN